jgi:hypothetical protein
MKGVSGEEMALRPDLVAALHHRIQAIRVPDGGSGEGGTADQNGARPGIQFDSSGFLHKIHLSSDISATETVFRLVSDVSEHSSVSCEQQHTIFQCVP